MAQHAPTSQVPGDRPAPKRRRWLAVAGWTALALVLALYIGFPATMAAVATWPSRAAVGATPAGFESVTFERADGVKLAGWYAPSRNGGAIVVAHGAGGSRGSVRRQARMLSEHGYGVLAIDMSGHGESQGRVNRLAWEGTQDIAAAVAFLEQQPGIDRLGAYGSSMGGEAVLGASAECPQLLAIVADGATRRSTGELLALPSERPLVRSFTARVMYAAVGIFTRQASPTPLLDEMLRGDSARFLLIAAENNELETSFNRYFDDRLGARADLWVVPGVDHVGALSAHPDEYERRVLGFFDEQLAR